MNIQTVEKIIILCAAIATIVSATLVCTQTLIASRSDARVLAQVQPCVVTR